MNHIPFSLVVGAIVIPVLALAFVFNKPQDPIQCQYTQEQVHEYIRTAYEYGRESVILEAIE